MADTSLSEKKLGLLIWQVSNYWQSKLRNLLKDHNLTLNEYLILESIKMLNESKKELSQIDISKFSGIDVSVTSVTFKLLENKKLIVRKNKSDNRKKNVEISSVGISLFDKIYPIIIKQEKEIFGKLQNENYNFTNSLRLLLGKSLRVKVNKI
tara:strand:+ start:1035 stop:1493 length:459 start_codon:yes stop_codon:yes gene_type:complete